MDILSPAHKTFLLELLESKVNFMLIGGYAVNFHGYPRYTADMDIWIKPDNENKSALIEFFIAKEYNEKGINYLRSLDFTKAIAFHIGAKEARIDFLTRISGVLYSDAEKQKALLPLSDKFIPVIQYEHLILNKKASARLKDLGDVDELTKINRFKKKD